MKESTRNIKTKRRSRLRRKKQGGIWEMPEEAALVRRWKFISMVKTGSLLSVGLCRFMEFME